MIAQLCTVCPVFGTRVVGLVNEIGGRAGELSEEEEFESVNNSFSELTNLLKPPEWQTRICNPFKRFASKSYYFDLKSGKTFIAIELKRVHKPQGLYLKIYINQVWQIRKSAVSKKIQFELATPPRTKKGEDVVVDLLNDDVQIRSFELKNKGKKQYGIEFTLGASGKKFAFAGGNFYPRFQVKRAIALATEKAKSSVDKTMYASASKEDIIITPALQAAKVLGTNLALNLGLFVVPFAILHGDVAWLFPSTLMPLHAAGTMAAAVFTYKRHAKHNRDAKLTAAEKIHEVIWCLSTITDKCSPISSSKNCFLVCDHPNEIRSKIFVRPLVAQKKQFKCPHVTP